VFAELTTRDGVVIALNAYEVVMVEGYEDDRTFIRTTMAQRLEVRGTYDETVQKIREALRDG
jgi:hypothetical protein